MNTPSSACPGPQSTASRQPIIDLIAYGPTDLVERKIEKLDQIREMLGKQPVTWVNVERMGDKKVVDDVGGIFGLHVLLKEDVIMGGQRPKVEIYGEQLFIIARMMNLAEKLETEQLSIFVDRNFVVTFQECPGDCLGPVRTRLMEPTDKSRKMGTDYLVYAILDSIVDSYFPVLEEFGERLETLEDAIVLHPDRETISRLHDIKRDLLIMRRATWPLRDAINTLLRDPLKLIGQETLFYMRDCYDHLVQVIDLEENYRELASDLMDIYLSSISNKMNEIMKVLTIIATIFIPLTFIAGVYGMNFNTGASPLNMPELNWVFGYPMVLLLMAAVAGGMLLYFRRRGWF
jgi:magnesium transporter